MEFNWIHAHTIIFSQVSIDSFLKSYHMNLFGLTWQAKHRVSVKSAFHISRTDKRVTVLFLIISYLLIFFDKKSAVSSFSGSDNVVSLFQLGWLCLNSLFIVKRNVFNVSQYYLFLSVDDLLIAAHFSKVWVLFFFLRLWVNSRDVSCFLYLLRSTCFFEHILLCDKEFLSIKQFLVLNLLILSSFKSKNDLNFFLLT